MIIKRQTLDLFGKMLFETAIVEPPMQISNPMPNEACFVYVIEGCQNAVSEIETQSINEKEALLMKCGSYISRMFPSEQNEKYEAVAIHFYPEILEKVYEDGIPDFLKSKDTNSNSIAKFKADILIEKYFDSIMFYFENPELVNDELLILKLKELMVLLSQTSNAPGVKAILSNLFQTRKYQFKEVIEKHLYDNLSLSDFCKLTNLSLSSFKREFKRVFNDSPARYIKHKKLEKAKHLLEVSDLNVTQITFESGFTDLASFSVAFKEKYDASPSIFRQSFKTS